MTASDPIDPAALTRFVTKVFTAHGVPERDASLIADSLVQADLWGHQSHGVLRTSWYVARLRSGAMQAQSAPRLVSDAGAIAVLDGCDGIGQVLAAGAMRDCIARAKRHGIGAVAVRNSNHFGTAMYYTLMAPREKCIGFCCTNGSPAMAPWGGRKKAVGNNPWSIAAPAGRRAPMVLDISNTTVARGKIYLARNQGRPIPSGWAIDAAGSPTTDPQQAIEGNILPMGGHKGYAISVLMDVLSGVLSGSEFLARVHGPYQPSQRSGCGHLFIALNISAFRPCEELEADMEKMISELKSSPLAEGSDEICYPGEIEARNDQRYRGEGMQLAAETVDDLCKLAAETGFDSEVPWRAKPATGTS